MTLEIEMADTSTYGFNADVIEDWVLNALNYGDRPRAAYGLAADRVTCKNIE